MVNKNTRILLMGVSLCILAFVTVIFRNAIAADIAATITTGYFVPLQPVNLAVTIGDSSAELSWSPPTSNGGLVITDYIIEYKLSSGGVWTIFPDGTSTDTNTIVTSLANDNSYDFKVSAVNSVGQGPASATVSVTPGSPAQVIVLGFSDVAIPSITTGVRITNEGGVAYEYQYQWCITNSDTNLCGGGDDVFSASAAKLVQPGENWDTNLNSVVSTAGTYWFHVSVEFGSDTSYASQSFVAITESSTGGGGGGGGGGSRRSNRISQACVGADLNSDNKVSLIDFSILMVFFGKNPPFKNPCADINVDGKVNVVDFSILLNQWGKKPARYK